MKKVAILLLFLLSLPCVITRTQAAETTLAAPQQARLWNLQNADILSIINQVSAETGKNFVVDPRVTGKISLISSKPVKPNELYDIFLSVLELLGFSAIPDGPVVKIVPNMEGGEFATAISYKNHDRRRNDIVVRILQLERVSANQLIPVIRPLLPQWSNVAAYSPGNVIVLLGRAANLERIVKIVKEIDENSANDIDIVPLRQASATQLANVLNRLQMSARATGESPQVSIAADERSNSLLLAGNRAARLHLKYLISRLDIPPGSAEGNTEVIYLRYLQAKTFAPILNKIAQNMKGKNKDSIGSVTSAAGNNVTPTNENANATTNDTTGATGSTTAGPTIQAENSTNAIVITAPPEMMRALRAVVARLDIRPAQVLVEGIIVQVNQNDLQNLGIQWGTLVSSFSSSSATNASTTNPSGFPLPGAGTLGIIPNTDIAAILSFLETRDDANILSTPSVTVLDNQKATLEIGQDVPYSQGSYATTGNTSTVTPFNTIAPKPVTLKLEVTPQINLGKTVGLTIALKNDTLQNPESPSLTPIINTSSIKNAVLINSGDVLVIGGLISNSATQVINKVPLLGDLPVIGKAFFQQKIHKVQKQNLLVFIKPIILRSTSEADNVTENKYNFIRDQETRWPMDLSAESPEHAPNLIPLWKNNVKLPSPFAGGHEHS